MKSVNLDSKLLKDWIINLMIASNLQYDSAELISNSLVQTSLWGIDSHGIERVPHYLGRIKNGTINSIPKLNFERTAASSGVLDGDDGHGIVIMMKATEHVAELAQESGIGAVGVFNSSHCGAIGLYTRKLANEGLVAIAFTHSDSLVQAYGGKHAFFGTNPISVAFPRLNSDQPICLDMATSQVPWNRIMNARLNNRKVEMGLGVDEEGNDSDDPHKIVAVKPAGGHKGFGLGMIIDLFCGPLNGMNFGPTITSMYGDLDKKRKLGSFVIALDPDKFVGKVLLMEIIEKLLNKLKEMEPDTLFPGEPEYVKMLERSVSGIPLSERAVEDFKKWSMELNVKGPF